MRFLATALVIAVVMAAPAALAHSMIKEVNIASGDVFSSAPEVFEITFSEDIALADLELETSAGQAVDFGFEADTDMSASYSVALPTLDAGDYLLTWPAIARDGHIMSDTIAFSVK